MAWLQEWRVGGSELRPASPVSGGLRGWTCGLKLHLGPASHWVTGFFFLMEIPVFQKRGWRVRLNLPAATVQLFQLYTKGCPDSWGDLWGILSIPPPQRVPPTAVFKLVHQERSSREWDLPRGYFHAPSHAIAPWWGPGLIHDSPPLKMGAIPFDFPCQDEERLGLGHELFRNHPGELINCIIFLYSSFLIL